MEEEHLHHLPVVFEHFREHNLKLKPTKCEFFKNKINSLAPHVSRAGVQPGKENLKAVAIFTPPQTYTKIQAFFGLVGHYWWFIKGFTCIAQPLHEHLSEAGASKKNENITLREDMVGAFKTLKKAFLKTPVMAFADFNKPFLLETDASKLGLGVVLSQKQTDGQYHLVAYASCSLTVLECNYHSTKQEFLAMKWAIMEWFQEYLLRKAFIVGTNNNPFTYIMTTSNLDTTWHCWVESLTGFTFSIGYQKGQDNAATDALSWVTLRLDAEIVKSILDGVTMGSSRRADAHNPVVAETDEEMHKQVQEVAIQAKATHMCVNLHMTDWVAAQWEDPVLKAPINWISNWKVQNLKYVLGDDANTEEGVAILWEWKKLMLYQGAFYHHHTLAGKLGEVMRFIVSTAHREAAMNRCHWDAGHQGQQQMLYLLHDLFWWPSMAIQIQGVISNCEWYIQHEGTCA